MPPAAEAVDSNFLGVDFVFFIGVYPPYGKMNLGPRRRLDGALASAEEFALGCDRAHPFRRAPGKSALPGTLGDCRDLSH